MQARSRWSGYGWRRSGDYAVYVPRITARWLVYADASLELFMLDCRTYDPALNRIDKSTARTFLVMSPVEM